MTVLRQWLVRLANLFRGRALDDRLDEELSFHVAMEARRLQDAGLPPEQATRAARLQLAAGGALDPIRETHRDGRGIPALETLGRDLRYAARAMAKSPGFTLVALLSLALGIGTNSAIFSVVDALLLRGLPVAGADRLAVLTKDVGSDQPQPLFSYSSVRILQQSAAVASGVMAVTDTFTAVVHAAAGAVASPTTPGLAAAAAGAGSGDADTETADAQLVSGNLFTTLGVGAALGRTFTAAEDVAPGGHPVAVMSHGYWQRRFGGDPTVLGRVLQVNGGAVTVLGVLPRTFRGVLADQAPDLFLPMTLRDLVRFRGSMSVDGPDDPRQPV